MTSFGNLNERDSEDLIQISAFARKLYNIINNPLNNSIISWNKSGDQFIIFNPTEFAEKILSGDEFSSSNYASFVRQLNMYDFHKVKNRIKDKSDVFFNKYFIRDRPSLLKNIKRKTPNNNQQGNSSNEEINDKPNIVNKKYLSFLPESSSSSNNNKNQKQIKQEESEIPKRKKISKQVLSSLYSNFLKVIHSGKKKQDEIDKKIECLYKQNLELIAHNKTLLSEINNKTDYTKTLEQLFVFILDFFMKKNENSDLHGAFPKNQDYLNIDNVKKLIFSSTTNKEATQPAIHNNLSNKINYPMLANENQINSIPSSPYLFYGNNMSSPKIDSYNQFNTLDLFDNSENHNKLLLSRRNSISSSPYLHNDDYMNVTNSPQTEFSGKKRKQSDEKIEHNMNFSSSDIFINNK